MKKRNSRPTEILKLGDLAGGKSGFGKVKMNSSHLTC